MHILMGQTTVVHKRCSSKTNGIHSASMLCSWSVMTFYCCIPRGLACCQWILRTEPKFILQFWKKIQLTKIIVQSTLFLLAPIQLLVQCLVNWCMSIMEERVTSTTWTIQTYRVREKLWCYDMEEYLRPIRCPLSFHLFYVWFRSQCYVLENRKVQRVLSRRSVTLLWEVGQI